MFLEAAFDSALQVGDGAKNAALEPSLCEGSEEALDGVEPGGRLRREGERPSRMTFEPSANVGMFAGRVVVDDDADRPSRRNLFLDDIDEADEFLAAWRCMPGPITAPSRTFTAANSVVAPCRA